MNLSLNHLTKTEKVNYICHLFFSRENFLKKMIETDRGAAGGKKVATYGNITTYAAANEDQLACVRPAVTADSYRTGTAALHHRDSTRVKTMQNHHQNFNDVTKFQFRQS